MFGVGPMLNDSDPWPIRCPCGHTKNAEIGFLWNLDTFECEMCRSTFTFDKHEFRAEVDRTKQHVGAVQRPDKTYLGERAA
jgi:hypothetical protein